MSLEEITANLERAQESIEAAQELFDNEHYNFAASRAYYAAFYASSAALFSKSLSFKKHSGVIAAVHKEFIKTGRIEKGLGADLNWLFELRSVGDYGVTINVPQQDAKKAINIACTLVSKMKKIAAENQL